MGVVSASDHRNNAQPAHGIQAGQYTADRYNEAGMAGVASFSDQLAHRHQKGIVCGQMAVEKASSETGFLGLKQVRLRQSDVAGETK